MPTGVSFNRSNVDSSLLPMEVSRDIIQKVQEESVIMRFARQTSLPGQGKVIPVITGDVEPDWVTETGVKKVSRPSLDKKLMQPHKMAVIVPFSEEFRRDLPALYDALVARIPRTLAAKFDKTALFGPDSGTTLANFDNLSTATAYALDTASNAADATPVYDGLVAADVDINEEGGVVSGYVFSPQGRGMLLTAKDGNKRPLFTPGVASAAVPMILGAPVSFSKAVYKAGSSGGTDIVGFAGDWSYAQYGVSSALRMSYSDQATLQDGNATINLWQQNMFAIRVEWEVGFIADTNYFAKLTRAHA